jgi:hypothetical protein
VKNEKWLSGHVMGSSNHWLCPFALTNPPASFQEFINDTLRPFLDIFCTAFLDDILINSDNLKEHREHVTAVMTSLKEAGLYLKAEKFEFHKEEVKYLELIVGVNGIRMDPENVQADENWEVPEQRKEVQDFLAFANFNRRFIRNYSRIVQPLTKLTKILVPFLWGPDQKRAFAEHKVAFTTAPVLSHFDCEKAIVLETDASNYVSAGVLTQYDDQGILHPVAFFSKKHTSAEENYKIYNQ